MQAANADLGTMTALPGIAFLGGGNMAEAMIAGLQGSARISVADPSEARRILLSERYTVRCHADVPTLLAAVDAPPLWVLATKPQILESALQPLQASLAPDQLLLSIAAGTRIASIRQWTGRPRQPVVRAMPNTPALVGAGVTGLYAADGVTETQRKQAGEILAAVGSICWLDSEEQLDAVTAISGSGPAYYFLFTEALVEAAVALGLDPQTAQKLATDTAAGAARLMQASDDEIAELRRRVTSPGGTTEQAIASFNADGLREIVLRAARAAAGRAAELGATTPPSTQPPNQ